MYNNYNYPIGADTPDAPWNESDPDPINIKLALTESLSKKTSVLSVNYIKDGLTGYEDYDLCDTLGDFVQYYTEQHYTINELLCELAKYIKGELEGGVKGQRKLDLQLMLEDCEGWEAGDIEIDDYEEP